MVGDNAYAARNLYTYMLAQNAVMFPTPRRIRLLHAGGRAHRRLLPVSITASAATAPLTMDTPAAIATFMSGEGGVYPTGTWMIGSVRRPRRTRPGARCTKAMPSIPYPRLWGERRRAMSAATPGSCRSASGRPSSARGIASFFRFIAGAQFRLDAHRPFAGVQGRGRRARSSRRCRTESTSHRSPLPAAPYLAGCSARMPSRVLVGEEVAAAFNGQKSTKQALADAERRVNTLLAELD